MQGELATHAGAVVGVHSMLQIQAACCELLVYVAAALEHTGRPAHSCKATVQSDGEAGCMDAASNLSSA